MDIQRNRYFYVPNDLIDVTSQLKEERICEILTYYSNDLETVNEYIDFLLENELAFLSTTPSNFPSIPLNNKWLPSEISDAILEIGKTDILSFDIPEQLSDLNCQWVEIRYLRDDVDFLITCINKFQNTRIRSIEIIITAPWEDAVLKKIIKASSRISRVTVFNCTNNKITKMLGADLIYIEGKYEGNWHCGNISRSEFSINLPNYIGSLNANSCLSKKISIDEKGTIKNCPSMRESFGSIKDIKLNEAVRLDELKKYWGYKKDSIKTCNICEYRYICTDCRAFLEDPSDDFSKPLKCGYDPYTGKWSDWMNDEKKRRIFKQYKAI